MDKHAIFLRILRETNAATWLAGYCFSHQRYIVKIPPLKEAPTRDVWFEYSDHGDLFVAHEKTPDAWRRIEVKTSSYLFTCLADWQHRNYYLCTVKSYERATPKPSMFLCFNPGLTHLGRYIVEEGQKWEQIGVMTRWLQESQETYAVPKESVTFMSVEDFKKPDPEMNKSLAKDQKTY